MSRRRKLYEQIKNNPSNVKYTDFKNLLEACGYMLRPGGGGSHRWFSKPGCPPIHFPEHRPVKEIYIRKALPILEEYCDLDDE